MEQKHWAGVASCLLALLIIGIGSDPDGPGWIAGIGVGVLVCQIVLIWHMWEMRQIIEAAVANLSVGPESDEVDPAPRPSLHEHSGLFLCRIARRKHL